MFEGELYILTNLQEPKLEKANKVSLNFAKISKDGAGTEWHTIDVVVLDHLPEYLKALTKEIAFWEGLFDKNFSLFTASR